MRAFFRSSLLLTFVLICLNGYGAEIAAGPQSPVKPASPAARNQPKIVLYSVAWCSHCKEAKEYFTKNNIPFINKDVELDSAAMDELATRYTNEGDTVKVPVIVIGNDERILRGFKQDEFEKAVAEVRQKK